VQGIGTERKDSQRPAPGADGVRNERKWGGPFAQWFDCEQDCRPRRAAFCTRNASRTRRKKRASASDYQAVVVKLVVRSTLSLISTGMPCKRTAQKPWFCRFRRQREAEWAK